MTEGDLNLDCMTIDEVRELLGEMGETMPPEQLLAISHFVAQVGGLENALDAIESLNELPDAA